VIAGDTGHLTFGRSQTTLSSGNLADLIKRYCGNRDARFAARLAPYLDRLTNQDFGLDVNQKLHNILRATADDPVMREAQDVFFEQTYWQPALRTATRLGITTPLGVAVIYDSTVHGSWKLIRDRTTRKVGAVAAVGEQEWTSAYVDARFDWLHNSSRKDLRATTYRMDAFRRLIDQEFWGLELPLVVRGVEISDAALSATPPGCYDWPPPGGRPLSVQSPLLRGLDVRLVQLALSERGADIKADGVFGQMSSKRIKELQLAEGLPATGIADVPLIARLVG
jgi:chitosanase